jgi:hypothetical protein
LIELADYFSRLFRAIGLVINTNDNKDSRLDVTLRHDLKSGGLSSGKIFQGRIPTQKSLLKSSSQALPTSISLDVRSKLQSANTLTAGNIVGVSDLGPGDHSHKIDQISTQLGLSQL